MLRCLACHPAPALNPGGRRLGQMLLSSASSHGNESLRSQLGSFLDDPLHAVELEDREQECHWKGRLSFHFSEQRELHRISTDSRYDSAPYATPRHHVTFHAGLRTQHSNQVLCLFALERSAAVVPIIGNPPSSRHRPPHYQKVSWSNTTLVRALQVS